MTTTATTVDVALRSALADVNAAYVQLPHRLRDRLDPAASAPDEPVNAAIRDGDEAAALAAIDRWRTSHLDAIRAATRSTRCACDAPLGIADEHGEVRCAKCGREAA